MQDHANPGGADNQPTVAPTVAIPDDAPLPDNTDRQQAEIEADTEREAIQGERADPDNWFHARLKSLFSQDRDSGEILAEAERTINTWRARRQQDEMPEGRPGREAEGWRIVTLAELRNREPQEKTWLVNDLIEKNGFSLLSGLPKTGKTRLSRGLASTIAGNNRDTWLGQEVTHGPVLHISLEDSAETVREHYDQLQAPGEIMLVEGTHFNQGGRYAWLENTIRRNETVLTIIDTFVCFADTRGGFDANDYVQSYSELKKLSDIARRTDSAIMVLHHSNKRGSEGTRGNEVMGSAAFTGVPDMILSLSLDGDRRALYGYGRCPDFEQVYLTENDGGYIDIEETVRQSKERGLRDQVVEFLEENGESSMAEIKQGVKGRTETIARQVKAMTDGGDITCRIEDHGDKRKRKRLYRVAKKSKSVFPPI